jgi:deoxyadenosine/deoxycytidine kinase
MKQPTIIAITGKICSGKTTWAKYIQQKTQGKIYSFASGVKKYAELFFDTKENDKYKNRKMYQLFAEKMKEIDPNIWVKMTIKNIQDDYIFNHNTNLNRNPNTNLNSSSVFIIDDLRFNNEYNQLVKLREDGFNVIFIRLFINNDLQKYRIKSLYENASEHLERLDHISEQYINSFDIDYEIGAGLPPEEIMNIIDNILIKENV